MSARPLRTVKTATPTSAGIQTTLGALANAEPALGRLLVLRLPMKTAYHLAKLAKLVRDETRLFHEQREALIRELGAERPPTEAEKTLSGSDATVLEVTPANKLGFQRRIQELAAIPVTVVWTPLALEALGAVDVSGEDLLALEPLLVETAVGVGA